MVERDEVERPVIAQLEAMGWTHLPASELTGADREPGSPVLTGRLAGALRRINRLPGQTASWLDDDTVHEAVARLLRHVHRADGPSLLDANRDATELLIGGTLLRAPSGKDEKAHYIDWDPDSPHNEFLVVSQLPVLTSGGRHQIPDLVLFVNGVPLAVIECKSPETGDPIGSAIRDLRAYTGNPLDDDERRGGERPYGIPALFATAQLLVAATEKEAVLGTISSDERHYAAWRSVEPDYRKDDDLRRELREEHGLLAAEEELNGRHRLTALVLRPRNLLNIVRHYVIELPVKNAEGEVVKRAKVVCRHQQYRAAEKIVRKLATGRRRTDPGAEEDERGGVIWHTQGSGKSLTMAFLARRLHMHHDPELNGFTILVVTDRKQLQDQLAESLRLSESRVEIAGSQADVEGMLELAGKPGGRMVVFAMIQKYLGRIPGLVLDDEARDDRDLAEDFERARQRAEAGEAAADTDADDTEAALTAVSRREFRLCSESHRVLVLIDEAHRSHASVLHACLRDAAPNAARVGFTGTPIMRGRRKHTGQIFGTEPDDLFLDTYRMDEAEKDHVVVPVRYEGRTGPARVREGEELNDKFASLIAPLSERQRRALRGRWSNPTARDVAESVPMIRAKAQDMLEHYVKGALTRGFKAQVAAVSREAAVLYRHALRDARATLLQRLDGFDPERLRGVDPREYTEDDLLLLRTWHFQAVLRRIDFVPVISAGKEQKSGRWREWTDPQRQEAHIARFLQPLPELPPDNPWATVHVPEPDPLPLGQVRPGGLNPWSGAAPAPSATPAEEPPIAFLIVKSMLLTGFDAPIEQVLYLDRPIRDAELLQAVARVNRPAPAKEHGLVVDYYGVLSDLGTTLAAYRDDPPVREGMVSIASEVPAMEEAAKELSRFLERHGIRGLDEPGGMRRAVLALKDEEVRAEFDELLRTFLKTLDRVLPHEKALGRVADATWWTLLQKRARRLYRDAPGGDFSLRAYGREVRAMIADHLELPEINQEIVPVSIMDAGFDDAVRRVAEVDVELAAAEQVHGLRYHLEQRERRERPVLYRELSQALEEVLREFEGRWEEIRERLEPLIERARKQDEADPAQAGLTPSERLLYAQLSDRLAGSSSPFGALAPEQVRKLAERVHGAVVDRVSLASYTNDEQQVTELETHVFQTLRRALREAGLPRDVEAARSIARALAGHVQEYLPQYRRAGGGGVR
ncbi:type I restriction endonuclease subunit R [Streptomyces sp. enrichment culture]|uniref:type I restriction endonuclease subunit R n=1 Tax=Streptomyces sp. enrichment culture TaxID=1795815 RepID=UPI003F542EEE